MCAWCLVPDHIVIQIVQQTNPVNSENNFNGKLFFGLPVLFLLGLSVISKRNIQSTDILQVQYIMQNVLYILI